MSGLTSKKNVQKINNNNNNVDEREEGKGQGELYSPDHAIKINTKQNVGPIHKYVNNNNNNDNGNNFAIEEAKRSTTMVGMGDLKSRMSTVKDRVLEKLAAASVPSDKLENARSFLESVLRDVTSAAHGITKEALQRIKSHLADILPSLSPSLTSKMVDDAEKEAADGENGTTNEKGVTEDEHQQIILEQQKPKTVSASPASSFFSSYYLVKPVSKL